jgi:cytochrome c-type biogenesis protein CcmH
MRRLGGFGGIRSVPPHPDQRAAFRQSLLALVAALALLLVPAARASEQHPTLAELEGQVMCPVCHTTLDQSDSPVANQIKAFISRRIAAGDTRSEIKQRLVANFGPAILASPPRHGFDLLAWLLPILGVVAGAAVLGLLAWGWSRSREPTVVAAAPSAPGTNGHGPLDPELERRLDEELARFEG